MAERLQKELASTPFAANKDSAIPLHLSLGVATYPTDADSFTGLVSVADASLYASKQRGGDSGPLGSTGVAELLRILTDRDRLDSLTTFGSLPRDFRDDD